MPGAATAALVRADRGRGPLRRRRPCPALCLCRPARSRARRVGETHLRSHFATGSARRLEAIAFGAFDSPLGPALQTPGAQRFHLAGRLEISHWNGRSKVQLRLEDAAPA